MLSSESKVPLEHMFNSHHNCSAEWCFNTIASEEGKIYNETDDKFRCKKNDIHLYNLLKKTILPFQIDKVLKESLHMFDTKKRINEQCDSIRCAKKNNGAYHEPKQYDLVWWEYPYLGSRHDGNKCSILQRYKQPKPSNSSCNPKHSTPRRKSCIINDTM